MQTNFFLTYSVVTTVLLCALILSLTAQTPKMERFPAHELTERTPDLLLPDHQFDTTLSASAIGRVLANRQFGENFQHSHVALKAVRTSPGGQHYLFDQTYAGYRIYHAQIKLNLARNGTVISLFDNTVTTSDWSVNRIRAQAKSIDAKRIARAIVAHQYNRKMQFEWKKWILKQRGKQPKVVVRIKAKDPSRLIYDELIVDADKTILRQRDLNRYSSPAMDSIVQVNAAVFLPDPLTTAKATYGAPYIDANDSDKTVLNTERVTGQMPVIKKDTNYIASNQFVKIKDFSTPPTVTPVKSPVAFFTYTRGETEFEDVNAVYHISRYKQYLNNLGFDSLVNYTIHVDAHGLNGNDQSTFTSSTNPPRIAFGEGGVDDAEDADVIVHEYGHAISHSASPNTNNGSERNAIDEGLCDYIAASYSHSIDSFRWSEVFTWDGHNEFWSGRVANTNRTYTDYAPGADIYTNGGIFSATLMDLYFRLGREVTDSLFFQSLYSYSSNMTMPQAAQLIIQADSTLFDGDYHCDINDVLSQRALLQNLEEDSSCNSLNDSIDVSAGDDVTICPEEKTTIGGSPTSKTQNANFNWSPSEGLSDPTSPNPVVSVDTTTTYTVWVETANGKNADEVTVDVEKCYDEVTFLNTVGFSKGTSPLMIKIPRDTDQVTIRLYNAQGKLVREMEQRTNSDISLSSDWLHQGVYLLDLQTTKTKELKKLIKF